MLEEVNIISDRNRNFSHIIDAKENELILKSNELGIKDNYLK